jgi:hypothetical protein
LLEIQVLTIVLERYFKLPNHNALLANRLNSVSEIAEMPLYSVTCGDIGIEVEKVEKYLQTVLYLGKT